MHLIVVGAGDVGRHLCVDAAERGHDVVVIEADEKRAEVVAQNADVRVLHATIGTPGILEEAGVANADALIATTDDDSANLMTMFLGREHEVGLLVTIVNEQTHRTLFDRLGARVLEEPKQILSRHLLNLVQHPHVSDVIELGEKLRVVSLEVREGSPVAGHSVAELQDGDTLPAEALLLTVRKGDDPPLLARRGVDVEAGDQVTLLAQEPLADEDLARLFGER